MKPINMNSKIKVCIWYFPEGFGLMKPNEYQDKTFQNAYALMEWCRRNYQKIGAINDYRTFGQQMSHYDIMDAINGMTL